MSRAAPVEHNLVAFDTNVVPVTLKPVPADVVSDRSAKRQARHHHALAAGHGQEFYSSARSALEYRHSLQLPGQADAFGSQCTLQLLFAHLAAPLRGTVANAVAIGMLLKIGCALFIVAQDEASVFCRAATVGVVVGRRWLSVVPEHLARGCFDDLPQPWSDVGQTQVLAMRRVAEVEAIECMAAAEVHGIGARRDRHGLQSFVRFKCAGLTR